MRPKRPVLLSEDQGHSILITSDSAVCQDAVEIHGVAPEGVGNVVDLIEPQDVEGEAAQDGQDGRALADAAGVLVHGNVQYVVDPVLHAPMAARRGSVMLGAGAGGSMHTMQLRGCTAISSQWRHPGAEPCG